MSDYWENSKKQPNFKDWMDFLEGCLLCACDHGCNQWIAQNGGKMLRIAKEAQSVLSSEKLDVIVQADTDLVNSQIWRERFDRKDNDRKRD